MDWWTALLKNVCRNVNTFDFELLGPDFLQLSTKFGTLLLYHKQYQLAGDILLFADQCIGNNTALATSFTSCQHPQADSYTNLLLTLIKVHSETKRVHSVLQVRERIRHCINSAPDRAPEDLIPDDFCTVGITYLQEKHSHSKDFHSALQLFDSKYKCSSLLEEEADELIIMLENAYYYQLLHSSVQYNYASCIIAKRCNKVGNVEKEVKWLTKATTELLSVAEEGLFLYVIFFRLTRIQWMVLGNADKAVEHGESAYSLALRYPNRHTNIWAASIRLADILHQIDGRQSEAELYFEEALKYLPFVKADSNFLYDYQHYAELHLIAINFNARDHRRCMQHYGQWAKLELASVSVHARKMIKTLFPEAASARNENAGNLAVMDTSLDRLLQDITKTRRILDGFMQISYYSTITYYARIFAFILTALGGVFVVLIVIIYFYIVCVCGSSPTLVLNYFIIPHFCFHYFLYHALTKHRLWFPRRLPLFRPLVIRIYGIAFLLCTACGALISFLSSLFGLYLFKEQVVFVYSRSSYYNLTMKIIDDKFYDFLS